jgi:hypothetical protein
VRTHPSACLDYLDASQFQLRRNVPDISCSPLLPLAGTFQNEFCAREVQVERRSCP